MCGIAGYVGGGNAPEVLFDMLARLEYRGYDSAGIAYIEGDEIKVPKDIGRVDEVRASVSPSKIRSNAGIGHTRWATHGAPSKLNSHPHTDCTGEYVVVHNGIIENYLELKQELISLGHRFKSETDTEVVAHMIEEKCKKDFMKGFRAVLKRLKGSYALVVMSKKHGERIFFARNESPLLIGRGLGENYIASDAPAFIKYSRKAIFVEDLECGYIEKNKAEFFRISDGKKVRKRHTTIKWDASEAEKAGYHHFMLKEIYEEPNAASNALRGYSRILTVAKKIRKHKRVYFIGCGTAYHACLYAKYVMESYGVCANACFASEFRYSTAETIGKDCAVVAVSQSGETADTLAALKKAKIHGAYTAAVVNVAGSTMTRLSDDVINIQAGPEIAVASTKAYIGQLTALAALTTEACGKGKKHKKNLMKLGEQISEILKANSIRDLAEENANIKSFFFIGRRENYPTALEGALKLKEISYVHAEGYAAGELKHGPLALMDENVSVIAILSSGELKTKIESNIQEIKARGAKIITVGENAKIKTPHIDPILTPITNIVPLHLFAYYISVLKGLDPDKPRNLAKSVTVE
jgi:glutamine---fructose-6-phosphate transaminase (isomerizing)